MGYCEWLLWHPMSNKQVLVGLTIRPSGIVSYAYIQFVREGIILDAADDHPAEGGLDGSEASLTAWYGNDGVEIAASADPNAMNIVLDMIESLMREAWPIAGGCEEDKDPEPKKWGHTVNGNPLYY